MTLGQSRTVYGVLKPRHRCAGSGGLTLVEMLVSVALMVLIMSIMAEVFVLASETLSRLKSVSKANQNIRLVESVIRQDLDNRTIREVQPAIERIHLPGQDQRLGTGDDEYFVLPVGVDPAKNLGYFMIEENSSADEQGEDTDDVLAFTARISGRSVTAIAGVLPAYLGVASLGSEPDVAFPPVDGLAGSFEGEIIYFLRRGTLYRRVLLVGVPQPSLFNSNLSWYQQYDISARPPVAGGPITPAGLPVPIVNTLGDLSYRSTRYLHRPPAGYPFGDSTVFPPVLPGLASDDPTDANFPFRPLAFVDTNFRNFNGVHDQADHNGNYPEGVPALVVSEQWFGRPTLRETSNPTWNYPNQLNSAVFASLPTNFDSGTTPRPAEDALLTNVLSFDVKVWDPDVILYEDMDRDGVLDPGEDLNGSGSLENLSLGAGAYVDLGKLADSNHPSYTMPGPNPSSGSPAGLPAYLSPVLPVPFPYPQPGTWPPERAALPPLTEDPQNLPLPGVIGYRRGFAMPFGSLLADSTPNTPGLAIPFFNQNLPPNIDPNIRGTPGLPLGMARAPASLNRTYDTWCTAYTKPTRVWRDDDGDGLPSFGDPGVPVAPPYIVPVRGIQIKIRFVDPDSQLTREITIVQELQ